MPQTDGMRGPGTRRWSEILQIAQLVEDIGMDSVWLVDHFLYLLDGEDQARGVWECWSLLAALAATTKRVALGTLVLGMGFRNPALLARMAETVDEISGGRLILGVGAGYHDYEYEAFGFATDHKFGRFSEGLQILSALLKHGKVDFQGKYFSANACESRPRGPRPGGIPIMVGTIGPKTMRLMARYADIWNCYYDDTKNQATGIAPFRDLVDEACRDVGRDPATLPRTTTVLIADPDGDPWWSRLPSGRADAIIPLSGDAAHIADEFRAFASEGISHIQISLEPTTPKLVEFLGGVLAELDKG